MSDHVRPRIHIADDTGRPVGSADIDIVHPSTARVSLHVESGQLPTGARGRLVDAFLDDAAVCSCAQLQVAVPVGETEILDRIRDRCVVHGTRAAGTTCLVDATPPPPADPER